MRHESLNRTIQAILRPAREASGGPRRARRRGFQQELRKHGRSNDGDESERRDSAAGRGEQDRDGSEPEPSEKGASPSDVDSAAM